MALNVFATISLRSELYNYANIQADRVFAVLGVTTIWDTPVEFWTFDPTSNLTDNGTTVIRPTDILSGNPGRFLMRTSFVRQFGTMYNKEWNGSITTASNTATFDISSAGFTGIVNMFAHAVLPSGTVVNIPIAGITAKSNTSVTVSLLESKTTTVLLLNTAVEGLESHAVANTEVFLTVRGN